MRRIAKASPGGGSGTGAGVVGEAVGVSVGPDVVGVVGDDPGDEVPMTPDDREVEDGYEPANV